MKCTSRTEVTFTFEGVRPKTLAEFDEFVKEFLVDKWGVMSTKPVSFAGRDYRVNSANERPDGKWYCLVQVL